jgi:hypothetical protein
VTRISEHLDPDEGSALVDGQADADRALDPGLPCLLRVEAPEARHARAAPDRHAADHHLGQNISRSDGQFRLDLRLDKRAVWNNWLLDFYVDIINTTVAEESGGLVGGAPIRYVIPTLGFRGVL